MARIVMERSFEVPLSDDEMAAQGKRLDECLELRQGAWARSYIAADRRRMICEFEAPDAESVREALRSAGQTFDHVWSAEVFSAEDYPVHFEKLKRFRGA
jgi:hypothetical protein